MLRLFFLAVFVTKIAFCETVPSHFAFEVTPPAGVAAMVNPSFVYFDHRHGELYVADTGNDRVVIFDKNGSYLFEFSDRKHLPSPRTLAVDSSGEILALSERQTDHLGVFDYNGRFLRDIKLVNSHTDSALTASSFALDDSDRIYVLTAEPGHIWVFDTNGKALNDYVIFKEFYKDEERMQPILGTIVYANGMLVIPLPMNSQLAAYKTNGDFVRMFGHPGGGPGLLSFPVAAAADGQGGILVMDKHRHTLLQYDSQGNFVTELGGMGTGKGWFYHPISICTDDSGHCIVLQSFMSRVQAVNIPAKKAARDTLITAKDAPAEKTESK